MFPHVWPFFIVCCYSILLYPIRVKKETGICVDISGDLTIAGFRKPQENMFLINNRVSYEQVSVLQGHMGDSRLLRLCNLSFANV
jgi:hypothetical protein